MSTVEEMVAEFVQLWDLVQDLVEHLNSIIFEKQVEQRGSVWFVQYASGTEFLLYEVLSGQRNKQEN